MHITRYLLTNLTCECICACVPRAGVHLNACVNLNACVLLNACLRLKACVQLNVHMRAFKCMHARKRAIARDENAIECECLQLCNYIIEYSHIMK